MLPNEKLVESRNDKLLKQAFSSLIDAMRYAQNKGQLEAKILETEESGKRDAQALDRLQGEIENLVSSSRTSIGEHYADDLTKQISSFAQVALEQVNRKLEAEHSAQRREAQSEVESERTKTFKSIEAFLATSPYPLLDKEINLEYSSGAYAARVLYKCTQNVQYQFSLDTKKSSVLNKEFRLSLFDREMKVPVSLGKTWRRKEPVPDYERMDQYILSIAEATATSLIAKYLHAVRNSTIDIVYSKQDAHTFLTIEYSDGERKVSVTSEPALNKFLNSEQFEKSMERLWLYILELESYKVGLTKLISDDSDVLEKLDCLSFFSKSWNLIQPSLVENIRMETSGDSRLGQDALDEAYVKGKIDSLGESGKTLLRSIGLA